jgi:hypothetical protein
MGLHTRLRFAPAEVELERRADGTLVLRSPQKLRAHERCVGEWLAKWAQQSPERTFLAERRGEGWRKLSYAQALDGARRIGQALLGRGLGPDKPLAILSDNSIDHGLLALGAMHAGVPVAPISPAYSLMSKDFAKLKAIFELLKPGWYGRTTRRSSPRRSPRWAPRRRRWRNCSTSRPVRASTKPLPGWVPTRRRRSCSPRARPGCRKA